MLPASTGLAIEFCRLRTRPSPPCNAPESSRGGRISLCPPQSKTMGCGFAVLCHYLGIAVASVADGN